MQGTQSRKTTLFYPAASPIVLAPLLISYSLSNMYIRHLNSLPIAAVAIPEHPPACTRAISSPTQAALQGFGNQGCTYYDSFIEYTGMCSANCQPGARHSPEHPHCIPSSAPPTHLLPPLAALLLSYIYIQFTGMYIRFISEHIDHQLSF